MRAAILIIGMQPAIIIIGIVVPMSVSGCWAMVLVLVALTLEEFLLLLVLVPHKPEPGPVVAQPRGDHVSLRQERRRGRISEAARHLECNVPRQGLVDL
jgi:hypothetical protein